ncbi:MAG: MBL fold metallo-hydrolase [Candidatus Parcubacteria bacterium]|nr:MBL fold metallo-hydrolase [Candidatus Parcubacteria bacterium]
MKLIILGSGTGLARAERGEPGYLIEVDNKLILVDSGSGVKRQVVKSGHDLFKITHIFYTHTHVDHVADLPAILYPFVWGFKGKKEIVIIGPKKFKGFYRQAMMAFIPKLKTGKLAHLSIRIKEVLNNSFKFGGLQIRSKLMNKMITRGTYSPFEIGYRFNHKNKSVVFCGDAGIESEKSIIVLAKDCDLLVIDTGTRDGHLTAKQVGLIGQKAGVKKLLLTHLYPEAEKTDLRKEAKKYFKGQVIVAKDLMKIEI